jgi:GTP-binding protein HflX
LIDRPHGGERAVLVHIDFPAEGMQEDLIEFKELVCSAGATPVGVVTGTRHMPDSKYFIGIGKAEEIQAYIATHQAELVLFNHALSPTQERNLERLLKCRVLDRTGLILDIFAQRARSFEGKLQVELALLQHMATRLVRGWTHLERQRGGIGLRGGPGETQLETDRRLIRKRMKHIAERLTKVREQREQSRRSRHKATLPTVALVGYTNAGKSTLFNKLSGADTYVADQLFATLDPTLRRMHVEELGPIILADTVGFIRHLPHGLVEAFRATLEEVCEADLLLHVVDVHDERMRENISEVNAVLHSIGADAVPQMMVYNKIDLCEGLKPRIEFNSTENSVRAWISAQEALGMNELQAGILQILGKDIIQCDLTLTSQDARLRAALYELQAVKNETMDEEGNFHLSIKLPTVELEKLFR